MDRIKWTNKEGTQLFFYHAIDQGSAFHAAAVAKSHGSADAMKALTLGRIRWAGPPGTLMVDSGGEFCMESFHSFFSRARYETLKDSTRSSLAELTS